MTITSGCHGNFVNITCTNPNFIINIWKFHFSKLSTYSNVHYYTYAFTTHVLVFSTAWIEWINLFWICTNLVLLVSSFIFFWHGGIFFFIVHETFTNDCIPVGEVVVTWGEGGSIRCLSYLFGVKINDLVSFWASKFQILTFFVR